MSFNKRGPDRRPDRPGRDRFDRPQRRPGDWQPRERAAGPGGGGSGGPGGGDRPYQPRGGDRPYQPRGGDRPYTPRPSFDRPPDEGAMSIRLDPRRVNALKHLAGEAGVRPGDLVRQWVEERIDASRTGETAIAGGPSLVALVEALTARVTALETAAGAQPPAEPTPESAAASEPSAAATPKRRRKVVSGERVALHDEMIAVLREHGPMTAAELAGAIAERGRYAPPRSTKPLDAAMVSQRVSNPTYRGRFTRNEGRIGLAEPAG
jgi:hypothetical protein